MLFFVLIFLTLQLRSNCKEIEDITRWREDMNFMSSGKNNTSEILFLPRKHKNHIFELTCNVLFII